MSRAIEATYMLTATVQNGHKLTYEIVEKTRRQSSVFRTYSL